MKFGNLVSYGTYEGIKNNLSEIQAELNKSITEIQVDLVDDYTGYALQKLGIYVSGQIDSLKSLLESPIEFNAWISRNLFESYLISMYITSDSSKAKEFLAQKANDELDIYQGILSLNSSVEAEQLRRPIQDRVDHIKNTMVRHNLKYSKSLHISDLATRTGNKDEYDAFYKLYSKYVHPTSWMINAQISEIDNSTFREVFQLRSQYYVSCTLKIISDYADKQS